MAVERKVLLWLLCCGLLPVMTTAILSPSLGGLIDEFQGEPKISVLAKLVLTSPALAIALGAGAVGVLLDRWGRRPILGISLFGFAVLGSYGYWARDIYTLIGIRFLFGFCVAGIMTTSATLLADISESGRLRRLLGLQAAMMGLWGISAQTLAGWMAEGDWRGPFLLYSVSLPLLVWMFAFRHQRFAYHSKLGQPLQENEVSARFWMLACIILLSLVAMSLFVLIPVHGPLYFRHILHRGPRGTAFLISSLTAASSLASLSLALWRRHLKSGTLVLLGFGAMTLSCLLLGFVPLFWVSWVAMLAMGLGIGWVVPCLQSWILEHVRVHERGRTLGILTSANYVGQFLSPLWGQALVADGGHAEIFQISVAIGLSAILGVLMLRIFSRVFDEVDTAVPEIIGAVPQAPSQTETLRKVD